MSRFLTLAALVVLFTSFDIKQNAVAQEPNQTPLEPSAVIIKKHSYIQLTESGSSSWTFGDNTNVGGSGGGPWGMSVYVSTTYGSPTQTVTGPVTFSSPGGPTVTLTLNTTDNAYEYNREFSSQAALDAAYPNGAYTITFSGQSYSVSLTGDSYPAPTDNGGAIQSLQGSNTGTWNSGTQVIDPTQNLSFLFNFLVNYNSGSGRMTLGVTGPDSYANLETSGYHLTVNQLLMQINGGTFVTGGTYDVHGTQDNIIGINTSAVPGMVIGGIYEAEVNFNIQAGQVATPAPSITAQPQSQTINVGGTATFTVQATVVQPATYQWYLNGTAISGATGTSYSVTSATTAQAGVYTVAVSDLGGTVTSSGGTLTVNTLVAPSITTQPQSQTVVSGTTVVLRAQVSGSPTPTYQWSFNGNAISGAIAQEYVITGATAANAGNYTVKATNSQGSVTSTAAALAFTSTTNVGRLVNISVNTFDGLIGTPQALTVGFVSGGLGTSGSQKLLVRASGPVLAGLGVPTGFLPDPQLTVLSGSTSLATNAGWGTPSTNVAIVQAAEANTFAFTYPDSSSLDSATVISLAAGGYTMQVAGKSGDTGTTVAEIYDDTTQGTYALTTPRLINLSCKLQVAASGVLTEGFVVEGTTSKSVLIRASGPALTTYGVTGVMADPQLTLFNSSNVQIAHNAGWGGDSQLTAAMTAVHAFLYTDPNSTDSAILITLHPGGYTAQASSVTGTSGTALIEVYEVP